jgi:transposase
VYDNEKENWRILTDKEIYAFVKKPYNKRDNKATEIMLIWTCTGNGRKQNSQKIILYEFGINKTER